VRSATMEAAARVVLATRAAPAEPSYSMNHPSLYRGASQVAALCAAGVATASKRRLISRKVGVFFTKCSMLARSRPPRHPIRQPVKAVDVATVTGCGISHRSLCKDTKPNNYNYAVRNEATSFQKRNEATDHNYINSVHLVHQLQI
jgi:hypothetical protein